METALSTYNLLLQVYRDGLAIGLFSKKEVVDWADELIVKIDEPDYILIEISLSKDENHLIEIIDQVITDHDEVLITRVLLGVVYEQFTNESINVSEALYWIELLYSFELSDYEVTQAFDLENSGMNYDFENFQNTRLDVIAYLSLYKNLKLDNYTNWEQLNGELIDEIEYIGIMQCRYNPPLIPRNAVPAKTAGISLFWVFIIVLLLTFGILLLTGSITDSGGQLLCIPGLLLITSAITIIREAVNNKKANS